MWACDLKLEDFLIMFNFMRGDFIFIPPQKALVMSKWSLKELIQYLRSSVFEPLDRAPLFRLMQKIIVLVLWSSGRRK